MGAGAVRVDENPASFGQNTAAYGAGRRVAPVISGRTGAVAAAALLAVGVILGVAGLFPAYLGGSSLASHAYELIPHVIYLVTWTASAVLILLGGVRLRLGALLSLGLSVVTFGLFFADAGTAIAGAGNTAGAGLVLALLGWLACAAGSVTAFLHRSAGSQVPGSLARPRGVALGPVVMLVLAGLGVAAAFAPAWDSFTLRSAAGQTQSLTLGNAFSNPGLVIAGDLAVMLALAAVVIAAALWRPVPARCGAARRGGHPDGGPGPLGPRAGRPGRFADAVRDLARAGVADRAHDQFRSHAGVLDLLRVPRRAGRLVRVDALHTAPGPWPFGP